MAAVKLDVFSIKSIDLLKISLDLISLVWGKFRKINIRFLKVCSVDALLINGTLFHKAYNLLRFLDMGSFCEKQTCFISFLLKFKNFKFFLQIFNFVAEFEVLSSHGLELFFLLARELLQKFISFLFSCNISFNCLHLLSE